MFAYSGIAKLGIGVTRSVTENTFVTSRPLAFFCVVMRTVSYSITKLRPALSSTTPSRFRTDTSPSWFSVMGLAVLICSPSSAAVSHEKGRPVLVCSVAITSESGVWLNSSFTRLSRFSSISNSLGVRLRR